jgi:hypothetical protein
VLSEDELAAVLLIAGADAALTEKAVSAIKERHSKELEHVTSMQTEIKTLWKEDSFMKPYLLSADNNAESKSTIDRFPIQKPTEPRGKSSIESKAEPYLPTNGKCDSSLKDKELGKIAQALIYRSEGSVKEAKVTNGKVSVTIPVTDSVSAPSVKVETDCYRQGTCGTCSNHNDCSGWTCGCSESRCTSWGTCTGCPTQCTKSYSWRVKDYTTSFKADISESDASNLRFELLYSKVKNYCHPEVSSDKMFIKPVGLRVTSGGSNIYSTSINAPSDAAALKTLGLDDASVHISIKE